MTPKEKSKKLIEKFKPFVNNWDNYWDVALSDDQKIKACKKCALVVVDEKTETLLSVIGSERHMWSEDENYLFKDLQKLKEEIINYENV